MIVEEVVIIGGICYGFLVILANGSIVIMAVFLYYAVVLVMGIAVHSSCIIYLNFADLMPKMWQ